jgi:hypothetical protein
MPQFAPLTATLVVDAPLFPAQAIHSVQFEPVNNKDGLALYSGGTQKTVLGETEPFEKIPTSAALQSTLTVSLHRPSKTSRIAKVRVKLVEPVAALDAVGVPTAAKSHENTADITFLFSEKSTELERAALELHLREILGNGDIQSVFRQLKSMY